MSLRADDIAKFLRDELQVFDRADPGERYQGVVPVIEKALADLQASLQQQDFETELEEINFFKVSRPAILSHKIAEGIRYNLMMNKPIGTAELQIKYFEEVLTGFQSYFRLNAFYYQVYKNQFRELDALYFKRASAPLPVPLTDVTSVEIQPALALSDLFAKFRAYEQLQYFIAGQISHLARGDQSLTADTEPAQLHWTGEIVNLVELAYGLWLTGQLNGGNASLNQIVRWLESQLGVSIGIVQRKFTEIGRRKRFSLTKYLDQMQQAVIQKLESDQAT